MVDQLLDFQPIDTQAVKKKKQELNCTQKLNYDKTACDLPPLQQGETVRIQTNDSKQQ